MGSKVACTTHIDPERGKLSWEEKRTKKKRGGDISDDRNNLKSSSTALSVSVKRLSSAGKIDNARERTCEGKED